MTTENPVVVWCHRSQNSWIPFEPSVSNHIENANSAVGVDSSSQSSNHYLDIGNLSPGFAFCEVDLLRQVLRRPYYEDAEQAIDRRICHPESLYASNAIWEFESGSHWVAFDIDSAQMIEDQITRRGKGASKKKGCSILDLTKSGLPYIINVKNKFQTNIHTGRKRKIRRTIFPISYARDTPGSTPNMKRKRKSPIAGIKGTDEAHQQPQVKKGSLTYTVGLPREKRIDLENFEGSNCHSVEAFLLKYTNSIVTGCKKVVEEVGAVGGEVGDRVLNIEEGDDSDDDSGSSVDVKNVNISDRKKDIDTCAKIVDDKGNTTDDVDNTKEEKGDDDDDDEECAICFDPLSGVSGYGDDKPDAKDVIKLAKCRHRFHKWCVVQMYTSCGKDGFLECPICKCVHGEKVGNCPMGSMTWTYRKSMELPGHEGCGTLEVSYHIPRGIQSNGHPNPGQPFNSKGFPRIGYVPDTDKGRLVLNLLVVAFKRRLMFTIGTSATTGESDTVTWNDIHHKTEAHGNHHGHGYPDPNYLDNVLMELFAQGVTPDCLNK